MTKILITGGNGNLAKLIKKNLEEFYCISSPARQELDLLNIKQVNDYLKERDFDVLIHTAILGGRRTKEDTSDVVFKNVLMFENILMFREKFKMIINLDSAAIYDRATDIFLRKESDLFTVPGDYYGFSKYVIYKRGIHYNNFFNLRIFNIFHENEEPNRFIALCKHVEKTSGNLTIQEDKYFDFFDEKDFVAVLTHYIDNVKNLGILEKTINLCYETKYKLSQIAEMIIADKDKIIIVNKNSNNNYCGDNSLLKKMKILHNNNLTTMMF